MIDFLVVTELFGMPFTPFLVPLVFESKLDWWIDSLSSFNYAALFGQLIHA